MYEEQQAPAVGRLSKKQKTVRVCTEGPTPPQNQKMDRARVNRPTSRSTHPEYGGVGRKEGVFHSDESSNGANAALNSFASSVSSSSD